MSSTGAGNGEAARNLPKQDDYIQWPELPPSGGQLNRWSHFITREHDYPAAKVSDPGRSHTLTQGRIAVTSSAVELVMESNC